MVESDSGGSGCPILNIGYWFMIHGWMVRESATASVECWVSQSLSQLSSLRGSVTADVVERKPDFAFVWLLSLSPLGGGRRPAAVAPLRRDSDSDEFVRCSMCGVRRHGSAGSKTVPRQPRHS